MNYKYNGLFYKIVFKTIKINIKRMILFLLKK